MKTLTRFLFLLLFIVILTLVLPNQAFAGICGTDLYNNRVTGCYLVNVGGSVVPEGGWDCGFGRQCFMFQEYEGTCGRDSYNNRITYCSLTNFGRSEVLGYTGCNTGEYCLAGADLGRKGCNWVVDNGGLKFCFGGFSSASDLQNTSLEFQCVGSNCGGLAGRLSGTQIQRHSNTGAPVGDAEDGKFSCITGDIDQTLINAVRIQIEGHSQACGALGLAEFVATVGIGGTFTRAVTTAGSTVRAAGQLAPAIQSIGNARYVAGQAIGAGATAVRVAAIPLILSGGAASVVTAQCLDIVNRINPTIQARLIGADGRTELCRRELTLRVDANREVAVVGGNTGFERVNTYGFCESFSGSNRDNCNICNTQGGAWTAIGCIPTNPTEFIAKFLTFAIGIAGGIAFLLILFGGFQVITSTGNPEKLNAGKELVGSAITGLLLILFSVFILRIIGVNILGIPDFG